MATWYTIDEARDDWPGAPLNDAQLQLVLDVAQAECIMFAPLPADTVDLVEVDGYWVEQGDTAETIPDGHRWAHLQHARNLWNAQKVNPSGGLGDDTQGFALTPFPLDWSVRARLRPRTIFGGWPG